MDGPLTQERAARLPPEAAVGVARAEVEAVNSAVRRTLYKAREPIYPKTVKGFFRRIKWAVMAILLAIYYIVPFIRFDRGIGKPDQAVLVDLDRPRLYFFWIELWPQEIYFLAGLLILAALALFLFTALFGRVWCGYACPQTVWTDLYIAVETWIEGDRGARIRLAKESWTAKKLGKRVAKHVVWLLIAVATGGAWVLYFYDAPTFVTEFFTGQAPLMAYAFVAGLTFTTYTLAGFMREQVCTYMCPWPRIQGAMVDVESISVTYLKARGEPRGRHKKGASWDGRGDCIDCNQCVAACPMGIDIRDGDQLECINCGLCIDACDEVMDKIERPRGLITYESHSGVERRRTGQPNGIRLIRTRTVFYAVVLAAVGLVMLGALIRREPVEISVLRDRNPLYVRLSNGDIRNAYTVKIMNRGDVPVALVLTATGVSDATLRVAGHTPPEDLALTVAPDEIRSVRLLVTVPADAQRPVSSDITIGVASSDGAITVENDTVFLSGQP